MNHINCIVSPIAQNTSPLLNPASVLIQKTKLTGVKALLDHWTG